MQASVPLPRCFSHVLLCTVLITLMLLVPSMVRGQAYFGTVSGELTDASGAVVQGANVMLSDEEKGFSFPTTSDSSGRYLFRSVGPGMHAVSADVKGFEKVTSARFKVDINENATTNVTVKVEGGAQAIQTEDAETGQVVNRKFINDLPSIDHNIIALTSLSPGVTEMDDQCDAT